MASAAAEIVGPAEEITCTGRACSSILYGAPVWSNLTGSWHPVEEDITVEYRNGRVNYTCGSAWAEFEPRFHYAGGSIAVKDALALYPVLRDSIFKEPYPGGWKWALNLSSIPPALSALLTGLELRLTGSAGIVREDVRRDGYDLYAAGCRWGFSDLAEAGFSLSMNRSSILIGNVSGKEALWLDPVVTLGNVTSAIQGDTRVRDSTPNTNFGSDSYITASNLTRAYIMLNYSHLNMSNASNAVLYLWRQTESVGTANFSITARMRRCNDSFFDEDTLVQNNVTDYLTDCESGANASEASGNEDEWFKFNLTSTINGQTDGSVALVLNYTNSTAAFENCPAFPWCLAAFSSKEHSNASQRPYLNITYYRNTGPNATASLLPESPTETEPLTCNYTYIDAEGDAENGSQFRWYDDGVQIGGQSSETLPTSAFSWGDDISCGIRPRDGLTFGEWANSSEVRIAPEGGSGGGGGGGTFIFVSPESQILVDWGRAQYSFSVITAPSIGTRTFPVVNRGQRNLRGSVIMLGDIAQYVTAEICDVDMRECSQSSVSIAAGQTVLARLSGNFPRGWGPQSEGIMRLRDGFTGEASDLIVTADRPPLAFFDAAGVELGYVAFADRFDLSEGAALFAYLGVMFLAVIGLGGAI